MSPMSSDMWYKDENGILTYNMDWDGTTPPNGSFMMPPDSVAGPEKPIPPPEVSVKHEYTPHAKYSKCPNCQAWHYTNLECRPVNYSGWKSPAGPSTYYPRYAHCEKCKTWHSEQGECPKPYIYLPYQGFDAKKWPATFKMLLLAYHLPSWHTEGKHTSESFPVHIGGHHDGEKEGGGT